MWPALESAKLSYPTSEMPNYAISPSLQDWCHSDLVAVSCACFNLDSLDNELSVIRDTRSCNFVVLVILNKVFST